MNTFNPTKAYRLFHGSHDRRQNALEDEQIAIFIIENPGATVLDVLRHVMRISGGRGDPNRIRQVCDTLLFTPEDLH